MTGITNGVAIMSSKRRRAPSADRRIKIAVSINNGTTGVELIDNMSGSPIDRQELEYIDGLLSEVYHRLNTLCGGD